MKRSRIRVSDHALICYLERVRGVDIEAIRQAVARRVDLAMEHPGANGVVHDGFVYRLAGATVVAIAPTSVPNRRTGRRAGTAERDE